MSNFQSQMATNRTYVELSRIETFEERFLYLQLKGTLGAQTFGFDRWINQGFYKSHEWKTVRNHVILRDNGCDLGFPGYEIYSGLLVHHMNPITAEEIEHGEDWIIDPNFLITTSLRTHNAIHYGDAMRLPRAPIVRTSGDTKLW
jgi:acetyltransferase-like isoleucine patch superfamily enzyme